MVYRQMIMILNTLTLGLSQFQISMATRVNTSVKLKTLFALKCLSYKAKHWLYETYVQ